MATVPIAFARLGREGKVISEEKEEEEEKSIAFSLWPGSLAHLHPATTALQQIGNIDRHRSAGRLEESQCQS